VYIKYGTLDAPPNGLYDDSQKVHLVISATSSTVDTIPYAIFTGLTKGNYYIYGDGYHARYFSYVKGGIPITINSETTDSVLLPTTPYNP
jgi:hypothetical protein